MALFEKTATGLVEGNNSLGLPATENPAITRQLARVDKEFKAMKAVLDKAVSDQRLMRTDLAALATASEATLEAMDKAVRMFESDAKSVLAGGDKAKQINIAGRQRMLSQKMSKEALLVFLQIDATSNIKKLRASISLFDKSLKGLKSGDASMGLIKVTNKGVQAQLDKVTSQWNNYHSVLRRIAAPSTQFISMVDSLEVERMGKDLLTETNKVVTLLEKAR
jgi:hypothetical protein